MMQGSLFQRAGRVSGLALLCLAVYAGCSLEIEDAEITSELGSEVPELVLLDTEYIFRRSKGRIIRISAEKIEYFPESNEQNFTDVAFIETDLENTVLNSGSADVAIYNLSDENFELTGNVIFTSAEHDASFTAPYLLWNDEKERLFGNEDDKIYLERSSGTVIEGYGLTADLQNRSIELSKTSGVIFPDDDTPDPFATIDRARASTRANAEEAVPQAAQ